MALPETPTKRRESGAEIREGRVVYGTHNESRLGKTFRDFESGEVCERASEARRHEIHIRVDAGFRTRLKVQKERTEK